MKDDFNSLPWHDSELLDIAIDRRNAGERDEIRLAVKWPAGDDVILVFRNCYGLSAEMNFGVIAEERIATAHCLSDEAGLSAIRLRWAPLGVPLHDLRCYRFETSSTGSVVRIYASEFVFKSIESQSA